MLGINWEINAKCIIFNLSNDKYYADLIKTILLVTKHYIYEMKCLKQPLNFKQLSGNIYQLYKDETLIAFEEGKLPRNNEKWKLYKAKIDMY